MSETEVVHPTEIPVTALNAETLLSVVESFVLQEGTDYGAEEVSLAKKVQQVLMQIKKGDVKILFDPSSESITLITKNEFKKLMQAESK